MSGNATKLKQARDGIASKIRENPTTIIILRPPMVDDGFGGAIPDPFGTPTENVYTVRLSHERSQVPENEPVPPGLSTNLQRFILADHLADIRQDDVFDAIGKSWKIGPVDPLYAYGGIKGYQAPLLEAAQVPEGESS